MKRISQRMLAEKLSISVATVSRALHGDSKVRPETAKRILDLIEAEGYELDPVVSAGLSKVRRGEFYRETIAWIQDVNREGYPWMRELHRAGCDFAAKAGYKMEMLYLEKISGEYLKRLSRVLRARGIRGVILGPFRKVYKQFDFPWKEMCWVTLGNNFRHDRLNSVERDFEADILSGLDWLQKRGRGNRPGFVHNPLSHSYIKPRLRMMAYQFYLSEDSGPALPFYELELAEVARFRKWLKRNRFDSLVMLAEIPVDLMAFRKAAEDYPAVLLSPPRHHSLQRLEVSFRAEYEAMVESAVNLLHKMLGNGAFGLQDYKQTVLFSSRRRNDDDPKEDLNTAD
ncbi:MAG: helix-turn-helix domain-containing protein [Puniceicoccales bacterium]